MRASSMTLGLAGDDAAQLCAGVVEELTGGVEGSRVDPLIACAFASSVIPGFSSSVELSANPVSVCC
jgi:hypothetical protein